MNRINLRKILFIALSCIFISQVYSQNNFAYKATLEEIKETKFYKIDLPPQVVAKCKAGLEDIRIFDDDGKQLPYILKNDLPAFKKENLTEFPIIRNHKEADKQTHVVIENTTNKPVNNLLLFIKNTDASRAFSVSGSDDTIHWFIIKEKIYLDNSFNSDDENIIQTLSFPPGSYKYFQLTILGENLLPFKILKAGIYNEDVIYGKYATVPNPVINQKDSSDKKSYINVNFDDKYQINKLVVEVEGAKYFRRRITVSENNNDNYDPLLNDYVSSDSTNTFSIDTKNNQLLITINNDDNIPLEVKAIKAYQLNICLLTYLDSGKKYFLKFGDSTLEAPKYDLAFFSDSIGKNPPQISINSIERNKPGNTVTTTSKYGQLLLWLAIIVSLCVLCFFTFKMVKDVNKKASRINND